MPRPRLLSWLFLGSSTLPALGFAQAATPAANETETLSTFSVLAGRFPTGTLPGAVLTSIDVVTTPGAAAEINRALQTFPGVQLPDEGNALFVRGGDSSETITLVNGIRYPSATRLSSPTGTFTTSLDPFQTKTITFLNGGMSAAYGNVLSGVVDLSTWGVPNTTMGTLNVGVGAIAGSAHWAFAPDAGLRLNLGRSSSENIISLNGSPHDYTEVPNGHDASMTLAWRPRAETEIKAYALEQETQLGLHLDDPLIGQLYRSKVSNRLETVSWNEEDGAWQVSTHLGAGTLTRVQELDAATIGTRSRHFQVNTKVSRDLSDRAQLNFGAEVQRENATLSKSATIDGIQNLFQKLLDEDRWGAFAELDCVIAPRVRAVFGARVDDSHLARATTLDPRLSLEWEPRTGLSFSAAGGRYHQVPDFYYFIGPSGETLSLPAMRAEDVVAAVQLKGDESLLRWEIYDKRYEDLAQLDRNERSIDGGHGRSRGMDLFARSLLPGGVRGRFTYSFVDTRRTDPDTGQLARAPWDITHSISLILQRELWGWQTGLAWRYATGRPTTPVTGGVLLPSGAYAPVYGAPFSERLPATQRFDLLLTHTWIPHPRLFSTVYVSINNLLNRRNLYAYRYSDDFSSRAPEPSFFNRVLYFGIMLQFR